MIVVLNFVCRWFFITGACWCWTFTGFISDILMGTKFIWGIRIICLLVWCWLWMLPWCNVYSTGPIEVLLPFSPLLFSLVIVILWGRVICMCFRSCHQTCSSSYWSNTLLIFVSASPLPVTASTSLHSIKWINSIACTHAPFTSRATYGASSNLTLTGFPWCLICNPSWSPFHLLVLLLFIWSS